MFRFIFQVFMVMLSLFVVPYLMGNGICSFLKIHKTMVKNYFFGMVTIWALFQIITVPLVLLKQSFLIVVVLMTVLILMISGYGIWKRNFPIVRLKTWKKMENWMDRLFPVFMILGIGILLLCTLFLQHTDWDDSRFVVNAVDIVRTNRMFLTHSATGEPLEIWAGELVKDINAPWAVFIAYFAKITGISAAVMAHTVLPQVLLICALCVFWMLSDVFFKKDILHKCIFMLLIIWLNVFGHFSLYSSECFLLTRLWQGKAAVAGVGIPAVFLVLTWIYEREKKIGYYVLLLLLNFSMCLMSGMGVIIGILMAGCSGLIYGTAKKNWKISVSMWCMCIPNVIYYLIHLLL